MKMAGPKKSEKGDGEKGTSERLMVVVRVRPLTSEEKLKGCYRILQSIDDKMLMLLEQETGKSDHLRQKRKKDKQFVYDRLFNEDSNQRTVYEDTTKYLVGDVLNGFCATVFAYGATGSGKTFTMVGSPEQPGIMVRALNDLFQTLGDADKQDKTKISMSYLEIYNENIRDLLQPSGTLELREDAKTGVIQVAGLSEKTIVSTKEVMKLLTKGNKERTCEPTAANKTSSRSHALLQVNVRKSLIKEDGEEVKNGRLFMVDLAGSERAKQTKNKGKQLREGAHINRSLLALGNCINALAEGRAKYVNYRDSKLTRLLKDALSGNCRTVMVAHVSPCHLHREETRNTLIYGDRAKNISKHVRSNVLDVSYHVSQYQTIISELKEEIERLKNKITVDDCDENTSAMTQQQLEEERQKNAEKLEKLKNDLLDMFREQMSLRSKIMDIDSNILALSMEFERQNLVVTEWETEKASRAKIRSEPVKGPEGEEIIDMDTDKEKDDDSDDDEPEEVTQAWEDLLYLQKEQQRYTEMREKVEQEIGEVKNRAEEMEEALPKTITTDEQRELLSLLCKVHELQIEKVEMQSEALLKEHELRRRDLVIMRYDRQRTLCDEIITRQRQMIEEMNPTMPPELQELYTLYQMETQYSSSDRDGRNVNHLFRPPSVLSVKGTSYEKLPPIGSKEPEKLFDKPQRRHSFGDVHRPESVLSLRSPISSASSVRNSLPPLAQCHSSCVSGLSCCNLTASGSSTLSSNHHANSPACCRSSDPPASVGSCTMSCPHNLKSFLHAMKQADGIQMPNLTSSGSTQSSTLKSHSVPDHLPPIDANRLPSSFSASSSAPGTAPESHVPSLPPICGAIPLKSLDIDQDEMRNGLKNINAVVAKRRGSRGLSQGDRHASFDALDELTDPDSPGLLINRHRKSLAYRSDDSISLVSLHLDSPPRKARSRIKPPTRRTTLSQQHAQQRRRRGESASSSDGDSPTRRSSKYHRKDVAAPRRRRGHSLNRLERHDNHPGVWTSGKPNASRRQNNPGRRTRAKSPDVFGQVGFALHY